MVDIFKQKYVQKSAKPLSWTRTCNVLGQYQMFSTTPTQIACNQTALKASASDTATLTLNGKTRAAPMSKDASFTDETRKWKNRQDKHNQEKAGFVSVEARDMARMMAVVWTIWDGSVRTGIFQDRKGGTEGRGDGEASYEGRRKEREGG